MNKTRTIWLAPENNSGNAAFFVRGVGVRELMPPRCIRRLKCESAIIMHFHSKALCGSSERDCEEVENAFVVWPTGSAQFYGMKTASWEHSWIVFGGAQAGETLAKSELPFDKPVKINAAECFDTHLAALYNELRSHTTQDSDDVALRMKLFIHELARLWKGEPLKTPACLAEAIACMEANLAGKIELKDLAKKASLSIPRFCALFKSRFGEPPMKRLNAMRMRMAAQLLNSGESSIKQVAAEVGFSDQFHFSRNFKALYKRSPREFARSLSPKSAGE